MSETLIIAEVAQGHEGSFNQCFSFIDAASDAKVDAVKFQTHIAEAESSLDESWRIKFSHKNENRYQYWQRMSFLKEEWIKLREYAHSKNLLFMSSPFSEEAVDLLIQVGVDAWKVGSGEVNSHGMVDKMIETGKHIYVSSGMSSWNEIDEYVGYLKEKKANFTLLQCSTAYPTTPRNVGLNVIKEMTDRYACNVGFSDHSGEIYPSLAARALGATAIEVHFVLSKYMFGPDTVASLDIEQLKELVKGIRFLDRAFENKVDKDMFCEQNKLLQSVFFKKAVARRSIKKTERISRQDFVFKKSSIDGICECDFEFYLDKKVRHSIKEGEVLSKDFFSVNDNHRATILREKAKEKYKLCALGKEKSALS